MGSLLVVSSKLTRRETEGDTARNVGDGAIFDVSKTSSSSASGMIILGMIGRCTMWVDLLDECSEAQEGLRCKTKISPPTKLACIS